jgi:hypothetical protein
MTLRSVGAKTGDNRLIAAVPSNFLFADDALGTVRGTSNKSALRVNLTGTGLQGINPRNGGRGFSE